MGTKAEFYRLQAQACREDERASRHFASGALLRAQAARIDPHIATDPEAQERSARVNCEIADRYAFSAARYDALADES